MPRNGSVAPSYSKNSIESKKDVRLQQCALLLYVEEHYDGTPVLGPSPCSWRRAINDLATPSKTRHGTHSSSWSLPTSIVSLHRGRQANLVWSTLRYRAQRPEEAQTKTMTLVSSPLQIRRRARRRLPNCSSLAPPTRLPTPVASCQWACRPSWPVLIPRHLSWPRCFSTFRRTRHTILRNTETTVVLKKLQILKTTTCAFNSFNSFSQPWQSSVEIMVLKQRAVLHFQTITLTCNVSPNLAISFCSLGLSFFQCAFPHVGNKPAFWFTRLRCKNLVPHTSSPQSTPS